MFRRHFSSLSVKVFVMMMGILTVPMIVMGVFFYSHNSRVNQKDFVAERKIIIGQQADSVDNLIEAIQQTSLQIYQDQDTRQFLLSSKFSYQHFNDLSRYLDQLLAYNKQISAIAIRRNDGHEVDTTTLYNPFSEDELRQINKQTGKLTYMGMAYNRLDNRKDAYMFVRKIHDINNLGHVIGIMKIYVSKARIQALLPHSYSAKTDNVYLANNTKAQIVGEHNRDVGPIDFRGLSYGNKWCAFHGDKYLMTTVPLTYSGWKIIGLNSADAMKQSNVIIFELICSVVVLIVVVAGGIGYLVTRRILAPLKRVSRAMNAIEYEDFQTSIPVRGNDEIAQLTKNFNRMNSKLNALINQVYALEINEKNARIKMLQAYINPHFLYNTLDTIRWMSRMEGAEETSDLIQTLSELFRFSINTKASVIRVADEVGYARNYVKIQGVRFADSINFSFDVEQATLNCQTVSFTLQPLIENAIMHGLSNVTYSGEIEINVYTQDDKLIYRIANNGLDANIRELEGFIHNENKDKRGMSVYGVNQRIRLQYGDDYGLAFKKKNPHGLIVFVIQPMRPNTIMED